MPRNSLLTPKEKERLEDQDLETKFRKNLNMAIKKKIEKWFNSGNEILFVFGHLSERMLKRELSNDKLYILLNIAYFIITFLESNEKDRSDENRNRIQEADFEKIFMFEQFEEKLNRLINEANNNSEYMRYKQIRRREEAQKRRDKILEENPLDIISWLSMAEELYEVKCYEDAINCYDKVIELDPSNTVAWNGKGIVLSEIRNYDEAIESFDRIIHLGGHCSGVLVSKGIAQMQLGKDDEAIETFSKAIDTNPDWSLPWRYKGIILSNVGRFNDADKCFDEAIKRNSGDMQSLQCKADILRIIGKNEKGIRTLELLRE